ncbi:hypothetical protein ACFQZI_16565 [Mucilaginibacter lutimaris]|uniref:TonB C-terminal domain-containing protein n=1 Tax=Mucilaginibacter lutimaris TaxID=931629 RepID=A0ABW2ZK19_9SPHI
MRISSSLKHLLLLIVFSFITNIVAAQLKDSTIFFFKRTGLYGKLVPSLDSADFFRIVPPYKLIDPTVEIRDFYKDGKLMFAGNGIPPTLNLTDGGCKFEGICINYAPTGKRVRIVNYSKGLKSGPEYQFYPDGSIRVTMKNEIDKQYHIKSYSKVMDYYDKTGKQICKDGTGKVIIYNDDYTAVISGELKNSRMNGAWEGWAQEMEDVKYKLIFKDNEMQSGMAYQTSTGKSYPFKEIYESATCEKGAVTFISKLRKKIKTPAGSAITKSIVDSAKIYFQVEADGSVTHIETVEPVPEELLSIIKTAFVEGPKWSPSKMYGIPLQTQVVLSLKFVETINFRTLYNVKGVENYQVSLYRGIPLGDLPALPKSIE